MSPPTKERIDRGIERLIASCRASGDKVTPQRLGVYRTILASASHPGPEDVFNALRGEMPTLSLATVYKSLDFLEGRGLVRRIAVVGETRRYDGNLARHSHVVCRECGGIADVDEVRVRGDALAPTALGGFFAEDLAVQIIGVCRRCAASRGEPTPNRPAGPQDADRPQQPEEL